MNIAIFKSTGLNEPQRTHRKLQPKDLTADLVCASAPKVSDTGTQSPMSSGMEPVSVKTITPLQLLIQDSYQPV